MKKFLLSSSLLFTITISGLCQADTIDYWYVFLDNKLIKEISLITENPSIEIKKSDINNNSFLTIQYFRDTYCQKCKKYLIIRNFENKQIFKIRRYSSKQTLKLKRLFKMSSKGMGSSYNINLRDIPDLETNLFTLTLIK